MHTYLGPVFMAETSQAEVVKPYKACSNEACPNKLQEGNFCVSCGAKIIEKHDHSVTIKTPIYGDIDKAFHSNNMVDTLYLRDVDFDNWHVYLPNQARNQPREFWNHDSAYFVCDPTVLDFNAEREWLKTAYAKEMAVLQSLYKYVNVEWLLINFRM